MKMEEGQVPRGRGGMVSGQETGQINTIDAHSI
jgi:hypothetical protein